MHSKCTRNRRRKNARWPPRYVITNPSMTNLRTALNGLVFVVEGFADVVFERLARAKQQEHIDAALLFRRRAARPGGARSPPPDFVQLLTVSRNDATIVKHLHRKVADRAGRWLP